MTAVVLLAVVPMVALTVLLVASGPVWVDRSEGVRPCGDGDFDGRKRILLAKVTPTESRWSRFLCRFHHQVACCPDHSTFVHRRANQNFSIGMLCERCGAVLEMRP